MNHSIYIEDPEVKRFLDWVSPIVTGKTPLRHSWTSRWGPFSCDSLYDAYCRFKWPFSEVPGVLRPSKKGAFNENTDALDHLKRMLQESANRRDAGKFLTAAAAVFEWGSVRGNLPRLRSLGDEALPRTLAAAKQLEPSSADTAQLSSVKDMNAGFSKIYSLLLDGFPIYDSRVACGLGSLVILYSLENGIEKIPENLAFGLPSPQGDSDRRNPSVPGLTFRRLYTRRQYAISNLMAAWLLEPLSKMGQFGALPVERQILALESALFMVGYERLKPRGSLPPVPAGRIQ